MGQRLRTSKEATAPGLTATASFSLGIRTVQSQGFACSGKGGSGSIGLVWGNEE